MAIVDFLYLGEANVNQENLDSFLAIAEELQLKGLRSEDQQEKSGTEGPPTNPEPKTFKRESVTPINSNFTEARYKAKDNRSLAIPALLAGDFQELEDKVQGMMERGLKKVSRGKDKNGKETFGTAFTCKVCGKEGQMVNIRDHIEINHLKGISLPCHFCEKISRSRNALRKHTEFCHKNM